MCTGDQSDLLTIMYQLWRWFGSDHQSIKEASPQPHAASESRQDGTLQKIMSYEHAALREDGRWTKDCGCPSTMEASA